MSGLNMYKVSESFEPTTRSKRARIYAISPSGPSTSDFPGNTPAPIVTALRSSITFKSSSVASLFIPYPVFFPLQYMVHTGSSISLVFSLSALFSHSNAILTIPDPISFCSTFVCMASSTTRLGRHLGVSCTERDTRPFRYPNSVPLTRVPEEMARLESSLPIGSEGILQVGVMMGKDRNTERKTRKTLVLLFFLWHGSRREDCWRGSGGGGGTVDDEDIVVAAAVV